MFIPSNKRGPFISLVVVSLGLTSALASADEYPTKFDFGAPATQEEIDVVDIDIMPDGRGLPSGSGSYEEGKEVYEAQCSACHGPDLLGVPDLPGMPGTVLLQLVGGRGTLNTPDPNISVESYWPYASTVFDYIRRAMPHSSPGSLTDEEVYAVTAYILAEGNIIDRSLVLNAETLPRVKMPNEDGFVPDPRPEFFD